MANTILVLELAGRYLNFSERFRLKSICKELRSSSLLGLLCWNDVDARYLGISACSLLKLRSEKLGHPFIGLSSLKLTLHPLCVSSFLRVLSEASCNLSHLKTLEVYEKHGDAIFTAIPPWLNALMTTLACLPMQGPDSLPPHGPPSSHTTIISQNVNKFLCLKRLVLDIPVTSKTLAILRGSLPLSEAIVLTRVMVDDELCMITVCDVLTGILCDKSEKPCANAGLRTFYVTIIPQMQFAQPLCEVRPSEIWPITPTEKTFFASAKELRSLPSNKMNDHTEIGDNLAQSLLTFHQDTLQIYHCPDIPISYTVYQKLKMCRNLQHLQVPAWSLLDAMRPEA